MARKILYQVRTLLFNQIIDQDVAFFDGTTSGHLTSKLTNDISTMMEPIRSSLSTLLYNGITLVGGVAMCYWTSYELSMLAFVTVGPIMYLWDLYGTWSKQLTRRMLSALGEGNSIATEALAHVSSLELFLSDAEVLGLHESPRVKTAASSCRFALSRHSHPSLWKSMPMMRQHTKRFAWVSETPLALASHLP